MEQHLQGLYNFKNPETAKLFMELIFLHVEKNEKQEDTND
jgi:hypothetical protein